MALREAGELTLWKLAIKPGKPLTVGQFQGIPVIGLPGNPASTLVTFALLAFPPAAPAWRGAGRAAAGGGTGRLCLDQGGAASRVPAWSPEAGPRGALSEPEFRVLRSASWAEGLVEVREGRTLVEGEGVAFIPLSELLD